MNRSANGGLAGKIRSVRPALDKKINLRCNYWVYTLVYFDHISCISFRLIPLDNKTGIMNTGIIFLFFHIQLSLRIIYLQQQNFFLNITVPNFFSTLNFFSFTTTLKNFYPFNNRISSCIVLL